MIFPDRMIHKRPQSTTSATWGSVVATAEEIEVGVPVLISPGVVGTRFMGYGPIELAEDLFFVQAVSDDGVDRTIQQGDLFIDQKKNASGNNDVWKVVKAGLGLRNPSTFADGDSGERHHIEVEVSLTNIETRVLE